MRKKTAYYARCMSLYGTVQEARDLNLIKTLTFSPIAFPPQEQIDEAKSRGEDVMETIFKPLVFKSSVMFFRALPDGRLPAGVFKEVMWAREFKLPCVELPSGILSRGMTVEQTREYLHEVGQR